jgi:hypothetical protein
MSYNTLKIENGDIVIDGNGKLTMTDEIAQS